MILHFGDWHGEPPLVSQVYSERVLTSRVPLLLRGKLRRTAGIELYIFGISQGVKSADGPVLAAQSGHSHANGTVTDSEWVDRLGEERLAVHSGKPVACAKHLGARRSRFHPVRAERRTNP